MRLEHLIQKEIRERKDPNFRKREAVWGVLSDADVFKLFAYKTHFMPDCNVDDDLFLMCCVIHIHKAMKSGWHINQSLKGICRIIELYGFDCDSIISHIYKNPGSYSKDIFKTLISKAKHKE